MQFKKIDKIDQKILKLLSENSRISYVDISKEVDLSRVAIKSRIEALEERGIIEQYSIIINPQKIGNVESVFFDIEVQPQHLNEVADKLKEKECITDIYLMTGSSKLHVHAVIDLDEEVESFLKNELYILPGILKIDCNIILSRIKSRKGLRL